jgi:hypothetical protein
MLVLVLVLLLLLCNRCCQVWSYGFTTSASGVPDLEVQQQQHIDEANWADSSSSSNSTGMA